MKKQAIAVVMVVGLILAGTAFAGRGYGNGGCGQYGNNQGGMMYQQLDQATQGKITQFMDDNQSLRKEIMMKHAEKRALLSSTNPDPAAAAKIAGELFDLRAAMREKARAAGVDQYMGPRGAGCGFKGHGRGSCQGGNRF